MDLDYPVAQLAHIHISVTHKNSACGLREGILVLVIGAIDGVTLRRDKRL